MVIYNYMFTKDSIYDVLKTIPDPELGISIVDLGLIYDVTIKGSVATVTMTLTTMGCPLFSLISDPIKMGIKQIKGVKNVVVELTFEPPWTPEKMSEEAKIQMGFV